MPGNSEPVADISLAHHVSTLLPLAGDQRETYLDKLEPELASDLRGLLTFESSAIDLSQAAGVAIARQVLHREPPSELGRWQVVRPIGHGGMGTVYLVTREELGITQQAAAKLAFVDQQSTTMRAAIAREADALSRLQHGNIAGLLDFGITGDQLPFLVSEYINGQQLLDYASRHCLAERDRVVLFSQLLDGVAAAHAGLVLHLDIKPGNVLVTSDGTVKLIDFGLAGILGGFGARRSVAAGYTHAYASPEQLGGEPVTVRSDIYSLGVLLRELTAQAPDMNTATSAAGDIAAMTTKATAADPLDRYPSVVEFKQDIEAYLSGHPVSPLAGNRWYRWRKFSRRQWLPLALGIAAIAALLIGLSTTVLQYRTTLAERDRALRLLESERATSDFMTQSLRTASVFGGGAADTTVGDMLKHMVAALPKADKLSDRSKAWLASDLAAVLTGRGEFELALEACRLAISHAERSDDIEDDIAHWTQYALTAGQAHRYAIALDASERARQLAEPIAHWRLPWTYLSRMQTLVKMKRWQAVVDLWPIISQIPTERRSVQGNIDYMRGTARIFLGELTAASDDLQRAEDRYTELYGAGSVPVADVHFRRWQLLIASGKLSAASDQVSDLRRRFTDSYGEDHYRLAVLEAEVSLLRARSADPTATQALGPAIEMLSARRGHRSPLVGHYQVQLARLLLATEAISEATEPLRTGTALLAQLGDDHPDYLSARLAGGELAALQGDQAAARTTFLQTLSLTQDAQGQRGLAYRARIGLAALAAAKEDFLNCTRQLDQLPKTYTPSLPTPRALNQQRLMSLCAASEKN